MTAGLVALTLSLGVRGLFAGPQAPPGGPSGAGYLVESWRTDQGLPSDLVVGISQTPDGYLWVATNAGLARFDGVRFRVFEPGNTPALRSEQCAPIFVDREGVLWIPTMGGNVTRLHDGRFTTLGKADGIAFDYVFNFVQGSGGRVWLGTNAGLHLWDGARFHLIGPDRGLPLMRASPLWEDAAGWLWVCGADGMVGRWREGTFVPHGKTGHPLLDRLPEPLRPWPGPDGSVWTTLDSGRRIAHMRGDEPEVLDPGPVSPGDRVGRLLETRGGELWLGMSESGLRVVHRGVMTALGDSEQLPRAPVNALFEDREGNVWVGTSAGILRIRPRLFSMLDDRAGITDPRMGGPRGPPRRHLDRDRVVSLPPAGGPGDAVLGGGRPGRPRGPVPGRGPRREPLGRHHGRAGPPRGGPVRELHRQGRAVEQQRALPVRRSRGEALDRDPRRRPERLRSGPVPLLDGEGGARLELGPVHSRGCGGRPVGRDHGRAEPPAAGLVEELHQRGRPGRRQRHRDSRGRGGRSLDRDVRRWALADQGREARLSHGGRRPAVEHDPPDSSRRPRQPVVLEPQGDLPREPPAP